MNKEIKIEDCDVIFCQGQSWISKAIQWFTKSDFSHTAFVVELEGLFFIADAQKDGVNLRPLEEWRKKYKYKETVLFDPTLNQKTAMMKKYRALKKVGVTPYDFVSLIFKQPLKIIFGKWKKGKKDENERMYCSEYNSYIEGVQNFNELSPAELFNVLVIEKGFQVKR